MRGLKVGESRRTRIDPKNAYGTRNDEMIVSVPRDRAPSDFDLSPGIRVSLSNGTTATVIEVTETEIRMDANHELAGKALTFDMELVGFEDTILSAPKDGLERAVFGLGCFWGAFSYSLSCFSIACFKHASFMKANCPMPLQHVSVSKHIYVLQVQS